jgi:hypothetical protein
MTESDLVDGCEIFRALLLRRGDALSRQFEE